MDEVFKVTKRIDGELKIINKLYERVNEHSNIILKY